MRVTLIVNPKAGSSRGAAAAAAATAEFTEAGWEVTTWLTTAPGDAIALARRAADEGYDAVFACGGDGTLSQVLAGLLDTGIPAGIIPAGTGNDFARTIGLSRKPRLAARQLLHGHVADIDLMRVNDGPLWSVNIIGVGFDAQVTLRMNGLTGTGRGLPTYLATVARELIAYHPTRLRASVDSKTVWEGQALLLAIANAQSYGAGMRIAPMARVDDGVINVVLVEHMSRLEVIRNFPRVFRGTHISHPAVHTWEGREVTIETPDGPAPALVDGDVQCRTPLTVRMSAGRAKLLLPGAEDDAAFSDP